MKKFKKVLSILLCLVLMAGILPVSVLADGGNVAKIGDQYYTSLDDAIEAATDGNNTIELLTDASITKNFDKNLTFTGTGTITMDVYGWYLHNKVTFTGEGLHFVCTSSENAFNAYSGERWLLLCLMGELAFEDHATGVFSFDSNDGAKCAIYTTTGCKITVDNYASLSILGHNTKGITGEGIQLGDSKGTAISVTGRSNFLIDGTNRGYVNYPTIYVEDSTFTVQNCTSNAANGGDFTAKKSKIYYLNNNGHGLSTFALTVEDSEIIANNNAYFGITTNGSVKIDSTSKVTANENGTGFTGAGIRFYGKTHDARIESGAEITLNNNYRKGLENQGNCVFEEGVKLEIKLNHDANYGGGIYNTGTLQVPSDAVIYNNHADKAGDDIYNAEGASIQFGDVGSDWVLDKCNDSIDGWYEDGLELTDGVAHRWNAHGDPTYIVKKESGSYEAPLAYKAAHGESVIPTFGLPILWLNMEDHYSYIIGYPDGTVQPNGKITRAEVATIFFRLLSDDTREAFWSSTNDYSDVPADKWYNNAVSTLSRLGVISGYPDGTFRPDASITRAEFAKIAVSFCKYGSTTYSGCFSDVKASDWFSTCVETARNSNLIAGYPDGTFRPNNAITRAEACTIVNRTLGRKPAKNHMAISGRINWPDCLDTEWFYADMMEATNSHDYQMVGLVEDWNRKLPQRDWAALETEWSHAYSAPGGEVGR